MSSKIKFNEDDLDDDFGAGSSDEEYTEREKYLVKKFKDGNKKKVTHEDDEVLGFGSESDEESEKDRFEADSDLGSDREDGIPDAKAWGKKKSDFYNTNFVDKDYSSLSVREEESALLEEQEARNIQMQLAKHLKEADFSLDVFTDSAEAKQPASAKSVLSKVKADLSSMTTKQKQQLLKKDSPEFRGLVDELNSKIEECYNELEPIIEELKSKNVPDSHPICNFIRLKNQLHLTYATNITFYLLLKASQKPIKNHPILKRLVQIKELLAKLDEKYEEHIRPEVERLLEDLQSGKTIKFEKKTVEKTEPKVTKKKLNVVKKIEEEADLFGGGDDDGMDFDDDDDEEGREIERKMELALQKMKEREAEDLAEEEDDEDGGEEQEEENGDDDEDIEKRKITYQIAKNKGLTPHRKKEQRNPRVKHRQKFRKALIRRKGAIRTVRTETTRYSGEHSGIKSTVRKGIKIK